ncbi:hypothetical protein [Vibrio sp. WXL103]|uniref:hypothetical protein n=1 Tax=Vibrio sp. WXL103 TaxID=3450710 RepID=UPI003EC91A5B
MPINIKHISFIILWLVCFVAGASAYKFQSSPVSQFDGLWQGKSIIRYQSADIHTDIKLLVNESNQEKGKLIVNFSSLQDDIDPFQAGATAQIRIISRKDKKLTFSLENVDYANKEQLEQVLQRQLPSGGVLVSGSGWAIDFDTMFVYVTLAFGEELGVVLTRVN